MGDKEGITFNTYPLWPDLYDDFINDDDGEAVAENGSEVANGCCQSATQGNAGI